MLPLPHLLVLFAALAGTTFVLGGAGWLWYRVAQIEKRIEGGSAAGPEPALDVEELREELAETREETRRLAGRMDFVEKLIEGDDGSEGR